MTLEQKIIKKSGSLEYENVPVWLRISDQPWNKNKNSNGEGRAVTYIDDDGKRWLFSSLLKCAKHIGIHESVVSKVLKGLPTKKKWNIKYVEEH